MTRVVYAIGQPRRMETCGAEEPYEGNLHVRFCGGIGRVIADPTRTADCLQRPVRRSRSCSIPIADGKESEEILGATAHLNPKGRGDKSLPTKPRTEEGAYVVARQAPCDMAKAGLLEVQCSSVHGGPLVTASDRQVDSSSRQADGLGDLCESSTAQ